MVESSEGGEWGEQGDSWTHGSTEQFDMATYYQKGKAMGKAMGKGGKEAMGKGGKGKGKVDTIQQDIEKLKEIPAEQKVWVGGLSGSGVTWKQLQEHFNQVSRTIYAAVFEKSGTGCVAYKSAEEVQQAVSMLNGTAIGNAAIQVDFFTKPDNRDSTGKSAGKSSGKSWGKGTGKSAPGAWGKGTWKSAPSISIPVKQMILKDRFQGASKGMDKSKGKGKSKKGNEDAAKLKTIDNSLKVWIGGLTKEVTWKQLEEHFKQAGDTTWSAVFPSGTGCVAYKTAEEAETAIALLSGSSIGDCVLEVDVFQKTAK